VVSQGGPPRCGLPERVIQRSAVNARREYHALACEKPCFTPYPWFAFRLVTTFAMHEPVVIWLRRAAKSIRLNSTRSSCLERSDHATRHDLLSVSGKRSALSCTRPSWQMVRVSLHAPCVCRQRAGGPPPTEPGSKELGQMCSLHADRLQEGRQADGSDCTWKSWGNGDVFKETYIDKGAHPNVLSLGQYLDFTDWDENNRLKNTGLECSDEEAVRPTCKQPLCQHVCARS
jgi:hypothetical protein